MSEGMTTTSVAKVWTVRPSNPVRGRDFPHPSIPVLGSTLTPIQSVPDLFPGGKAAGAWSLSPTHSRAEVRQTVELHLYSPLGLLLML